MYTKLQIFIILQTKIFLIGENITISTKILILLTLLFVTSSICLHAQTTIDTSSNNGRIDYYYKLLDEKIKNKNYFESLQFANKLLKITQKQKSKSKLDKIYLYRAMALIYLYKSDEALTDLHKALYLNKRFNRDSLSNLSMIYNYIGYYYLLKNLHVDSVIVYYDKSNKLKEESGFFDEIAQNLLNLAFNFLINNTKNNKIDSLFRESLKYTKKSNNTEQFIERYFQIINTYRYFKHYDKADSLLNTKEYNKIILQANNRSISQEYYMHVALIKWSINKYYDAILYSIKAININPNPQTQDGLLNITYCYDLLAITYGKIKMYDSALANFDKAISFTNLAYEQTEDINTRLQIRASIIRFNMHKALQHNFMKDYKKVDEICLSVDQTIQNDVDLFIRNPAELQTILLFYVNYFEMLLERKVGRGRDLDEIIKKMDYLYEKSDKFQANPLLGWYYNYVNGNYFYFFKNYQAAIQKFRFAEQIIGDEKLDDDIYYRFLKMYSSALAEINDFKNAYYIAEKYLIYKSKADFEAETINNEYIKLVEETRLENAENKRRLDLEAAQNKTNKLILLIFAVAFIFLAILIAVIMKERAKSEKLLLSILPKPIAIRLKAKEKYIADKFNEASIMFIDMASFTQMGAHISPEELVEILNDIFTLFDNISEKYGLEKIKTIGDCYLAVAGLPQPRIDHAEITADMALEVMETTNDFKARDGEKINFRIGIDCGPVVAGIIGEKKFIYDLWGDTVNTASRMEDYGVAGEIQITDRFKKKLESMGEGVKSKYAFVNRGKIELKGKGKFQAWFLKKNIKS